MSTYPFVPLGKFAASEPGAVAIGPFGSRMKAEVYVEAGVPVIRGTNISVDRSLKGEWVYVTDDFAEGIPNCISREGDLVFPHRGSIGTVALIGENDGKLVISSSMMKFRPDVEKADSTFLYYFFRSVAGKNEILQYSSSVGTPGIGQPLSSLRKFLVPTPDVNTQIQIAKVLSALDDKIELNRRMNETLEGMAQAIFRDWFVDFGPTRRKQQGTTNPKKILGNLITNPKKAKQIADLFPDDFGDDGLPMGWVEKPLSEIATFLNGAALQKYPANPNENSLPVIKIAELRNGISAKTNRASIHIPSKYLITNGDFLFSWSGSLMAKFWTEGDGALNQHLFKVSSENYPEWFFSQWVNYHLSEFQMIAAAKATTMGHIQRGHLNAAMTICPRDNTLEQLTPLIGQLVARTIHNNLESQTLAQTRDYLLPKLMSGAVRVGEIENSSEASV
jgi:type I restriction enzyme S subunit